MEHSHHLLAALHDFKFDVDADSSKLKRVTRDQFVILSREAAIALEACQKFDFSSIVPSFGEALLYAAVEASEAGLLALPFPRSFFDFGTWPAYDGDSENPSKWKLTVTCICQSEEDGIVISPWSQIHDDTGRSGRWSAGLYWIKIRSGYPPERIFQIGRYEELAVDEPTNDRTDAKNLHLVKIAQWVMQALVALDAKGTKLVHEPAPATLNKARQRRGKLPISEHTIVVIDTDQVRRACEEKGTHASPILHWRRGHVRITPSGSKTLVRPHLVGDVTRGFRTHDYAVH